ncbi:MAG: tail fiber domain-containing protein [Candidatus Omnitrophota bacterium]
MTQKRCLSVLFGFLLLFTTFWVMADEPKNEEPDNIHHALANPHTTTGLSDLQGLEDTWNTFYGYQAGIVNNGTFNSNSFFGAKAGFSNTTGYYNSFLGYNAGYSNTTGYYNTFVGQWAGRNNTTGYLNVFVGNDAGSDSLGNYNTFLGGESGASTTTGNYNTFIGAYSGEFNTTGIGNLFAGHDAGLRNTTGSRNTYLGQYAGYNNTEGNYNVFLGYQAGYNELGSNKLYIANASGAPLIYGEFDTDIVKINGYLGIGITPLNPLHMASGAFCSAGGVWTNASSRSLKENIRDLSSMEALDTLKHLNPVKYNYKVDKTDKHVGFIAEDVPELVATADRKGLSAMDVTAVLTKVLQEQQKTISDLKEIISDLKERLSKIEKNN